MRFQGFSGMAKGMQLLRVRDDDRARFSHVRAYAIVDI